MRALTIFLLFAMLGAGCMTAPRAKLSGGASAAGPRDNGTPARVESGSTVTTATIPAGSTVTFTPAKALDPVTATLSAPMEIRTESRHESATTGTIDTTVATKRIEVESAAAERRWLLWAAIACGVAGLVVRSLLPAWPGLSNGLLVAAAAAGASWKLAEVPAWLWLCIIGGAALLALGYKRAEWDKNGDGIPDAFQRKPSTDTSAHA
jgi:hypothetical protein